MIVNIAQNDNYNNLVDIGKFFKIVEITAKNLNSQPKIMNKNTNNNFIKINSDSSSLGKERHFRYLANTSINGLKKFRSKNHLFKPKVNSVNMINFKNVVLPGEDKMKQKKKKFYNKSIE